MKDERSGIAESACIVAFAAARLLTGHRGKPNKQFLYLAMDAQWTVRQIEGDPDD